MKINDSKGIDYDSSSDLGRAENADLITLPKKVEGTNCGNCKFFDPIDGKTGLGYCRHEKVKLPVTKTMCCKFWDAEDAKRSWKKS